MIARALAIGLAIEVAVYLWLGARLADAHGAPAAFATVVAIALAWRAAIVLLTYAIAFLTPGHAEGVAAVGPLRMAAEVVREIASYVALFAFAQPLARWTVGPPGGAHGPAGGEALLLVHGYLCNRGLWVSLVPKLAAAGYRVHTIDLEPGFGGIDGFAQQLAARLEAVRRGAGGRPVALVGHSMGGLVIRACLRDRGAEGVSRVVTLGSPHHGTSLAPFGLGRNAREMRRGSPWLAALAAAEGGSFPIPVTSIYSAQDNFISPHRSSRLEGAANVELRGIGHLTMAFSGALRRALLDALAGPRGAP